MSDFFNRLQTPLTRSKRAIRSANSSLANALAVLAHTSIVAFRVGTRPCSSRGTLMVGWVLVLFALGFLLLGPTPARADGLLLVEKVFDGVNGVDGLAGASSVTVSPDGAHVYATARRDNAISVFSRDAQTGALIFVEVHKDDINGVDGLGGATSVTVSPDGAHVYTTGFRDNAVSVFSRDAQTGALIFVEVHKDRFNGVDGLAVADSVTVSPDGAQVYAKGGNTVAVFSRDAQTGALTFVEVQRDGVNGVDGLKSVPSVVTVSPEGAHVYATGIADDAVAVFSRDAQTGALTFVEVQRDGVNGVDGLAGAKSVTVSPDGAHVYVVGSNVGRPNFGLAVFGRDVQTGKLTFVEVHKDGINGVVGLETLASVTISPDGAHVYVAAFFPANTVVVFSRDVQTGALTFVEVQRDGAGTSQPIEAVVTVSPDSAHVYATGEADNSLVVFRHSSGGIANPKPNVTTNDATAVGVTSATLNATVNPNGFTTNVHFDYGTTTSYGTQTPPENIGSGVSNVAVAHPVSDLACGTTYHFRAVATNGDGTTTGSDKTFTTSDCLVAAPTGTYTGEAIVTTTQCTPAEPDDVFTATGTLSANAGPPGPFGAAGTLVTQRFGIRFFLTLNLSGSVTDQGQVSGTYSETFVGENGFTSSGTGTFTGTITTAQLILEFSGKDTDSGGITCNADAVFTGNQATQLTNISTRGLVGTGDDVMIGGFIIGGTEPKTVLIRARGPVLADFGVPGVLNDPVIQLFSGQTVIAENDNWETTLPLCQSSGLDCGGAAEITATGLDPCVGNMTGCARESAILVTLDPGPYTAIVSGFGGATGVGLVEVFEVGTTTTSRLTNISTRGLVGTGDNVMIGGFIIEGTDSKAVLVRARGPVLTDFGVPGELSDPFLQLFSGQTVIAQNDDWQVSDPLCGSPAVSCGGQAEIVATGLDPCVGNLTGCAKESAILVTLPPGPYTAIVSGVNGGTGVGLVEVFEVLD